MAKHSPPKNPRIILSVREGETEEAFVSRTRRQAVRAYRARYPRPGRKRGRPSDKHIVFAAIEQSLKDVEIKGGLLPKTPRSFGWHVQRPYLVIFELARARGPLQRPTDPPTLITEKTIRELARLYYLTHCVPVGNLTQKDWQFIQRHDRQAHANERRWRQEALPVLQKVRRAQARIHRSTKTPRPNLA